MRVWLVWKCHNYEGRELASIHATKAGAEAAERRLHRLQKSYRRKTEAYFAADGDDVPWTATNAESESLCDSTTIEQWSVKLQRSQREVAGGLPPGTTFESPPCKAFAGKSE
ncbi:MAG TPA: hypothetical protein VGD74_06130 [Vulgatibacter sp.]